MLQFVGWVEVRVRIRRRAAAWNMFIYSKVIIRGGRKFLLKGGWVGWDERPFGGLRWVSAKRNYGK